jgi:acyl-CoA thioesterase-1
VTAPRTLSGDDRRQFMRYTRTERWPLFERFPMPAELHTGLIAGMLACRPAQVRAGLDELHDETRRAAAEMMADARFRAAIEALPFGENDRVAGVGDSITADRVGWFELLAASIDLAGPRGVHLHNLGVSGNTTADVLERFDLIEAVRPTRVLLMLGTNDARSHGRLGSFRMVTNHETERNLRALVDLITGDLGVPVTLITPPAVDQRRIDAAFHGLPLRWEADAVREVASVVRKLDAGCIDVYSATRPSTAGDLLEADGVHPTPAGQRVILRTIVGALTR